MNRISKQLLKIAKEINALYIDDINRQQKNIYNKQSQLTLFKKQDKYIQNIAADDSYLTKIEDDLYHGKITVDQFVQNASKYGFKFDKELIEYYLKKHKGNLFEQGYSCNCWNCKYSILGNDNRLYCSKYKDAFYYVGDYDLCDKYQETENYGHKNEHRLQVNEINTENMKKILTEFRKYFTQKRNEYNKKNIKISLTIHQKTQYTIDCTINVSSSKKSFYEKMQKHSEYFDVIFSRNDITLKTYDNNKFYCDTFDELFDKIQQCIDISFEKNSKKYDELFIFNKVQIGDLIDILQLGNYPKINKVRCKVISKDKSNMTIDVMIGYRKKTIKPSEIVFE